MSQLTAAQIAELHHIAAHAHMAAASQKNDRAAARELARRAHEYSSQAFEASRQTAAEVIPAKLERWAS